MKYNSIYNGVVLNDNELTKEQIEQLEKNGSLVLSTDDEIEIEDLESGELRNGKITIVNDDYFLFDEYDENGNIIHEEEMPLYSYLLQLEECGALDAYPNVELK